MLKENYEQNRNESRQGVLILILMEHAQRASAMNSTLWNYLS